MINNSIKSTLFLFIFLSTFVLAQDSATKREMNRLNSKIDRENVRVDSLDAQIRMLLPELQNALKANLKAKEQTDSVAILLINRINMMQNKMTGRPMQLDFGIADRVTAEDQVMALADATEDDFRAAGIGDIGDIFRDTVYDLINGGQLDEAMDIAKQGFSRLQKIKQVA